MRRIVIFLAMVAAIAIVVSSCKSKSGQRANTSKRVRAKELSPTSAGYYADISYGSIDIITVDTMYHVGDTISNQRGTWRIVP